MIYKDLFHVYTSLHHCSDTKICYTCIRLFITAMIYEDLLHMIIRLFITAMIYEDLLHMYTSLHHCNDIRRFVTRVYVSLSLLNRLVVYRYPIGKSVPSVGSWQFNPLSLSCSLQDVNGNETGQIGDGKDDGLTHTPNVCRHFLFLRLSKVSR